MFNKVLIANRGAIATRTIRTLRTMGIESVAIYSSLDRESLHVAQADEAFCLGDGTLAQTYLNIDKIIDACKSTGAQAVFPGYGFLSESQDFARRCAEEGVVFIGPTPQQMNDFGLKHVAREIAQRAEVPLAPGTGLITSLEEAINEAARIGYPIMLKSTAGGGGIGINICTCEDELSHAFESSRHLAASNFGNDGVFLERFVENARHIEVQIFGAQGKVLALAERDCSIQRRNQKVVEECPAPNLPAATRNAMLECSERLASSVGYTSAGTVEFLYDGEHDEFYFLEVNTRLQVEHGITEECCGVDLVEWMILEAAGETIDWSAFHDSVGHAIEVRCYAEDCSNGFLPATGTVDGCIWSDESRVETWVERGTEVTSFFDPMIAKIIVHDENRAAAVAKMEQVLEETRVYGITTNLLYIKSLLQTKAYAAGAIHTHLLDEFNPSEPTIEVLDGGIQSTVQDYPGITGYWQVGIPPCGPMDQRSFRLGNAILGNPEDAAGIELTIRGGSYRFRCATRFCLTGADMQATLDGVQIPTYKPISTTSGSVLKIGTSETGMRTYLCVKGGLDVFEMLGSKSTFIDGKFGGHGGRALRTGDVIMLNDNGFTTETTTNEKRLCPLPKWSNAWNLGVLVGPLSDKEFLQPEFFDTLTSTTYTVNYDSARTGIRLNGPIPEWARENGGEAGLHPSNIHDNPYSICALDLTGDQPILLGPDGPSLGGFVCPVVVAVDERWKLGQMRPGDEVRFHILTTDEAAAMREATDSALQELRSHAAESGTKSEASLYLSTLPEQVALFSPDDAILYRCGEGEESFCVRQSGEDALLIEFGPMKLDIAIRFKVHVYMQQIEKLDLDLTDITPGIRSLQLHFDPAKVSRDELLTKVIEVNKTLPDLDDVSVSSRIVHLPLSWDDPQTQLAAKRYQETTRPDAPWCPSNPEFIRRINGLDSLEDVKNIVFEAKYVVLGLGDVYLGAPVATPIDPRHRMVTTKYNPARPWTPENAVGIGGSYLCVYGMEGPGGYQFVGRTTQMWNSLRCTESFKPGKPWLLNLFDQLSFYPVSADEILTLREDCLHGRFNPMIEETTFNLRDYKAFLTDNAEEISEFKAHQEASFDAEYQRWVAGGLDTFVSDTEQEADPFEEEAAPEGCATVLSPIAGALWKLNIKEGDAVKSGQTIMILESMKMEFPITAEQDGIIERINVQPGSLVTPNHTVALIRTQA